MNPTAKLVMLTSRQQQIVQKIASGDTIKEIAHDLGRSHKTIEFHFNEARNRIGYRSVAQVTQWALKCHLIDFTI